MTKLAPPGSSSLAQAAHWYAVLRAEDVAAADRHRWRIWLDASPDHQRAWQRVESVSRAFEPLAATSRHDQVAVCLEAAPRARAKRRHMLKVLGVTATVASVGIASRNAWRTQMLDTSASWNADHRSATGEVRRVALEQGGVMWLNTGSAVRLIDEPARRGVRLLRGEIHIDTGGHAATDTHTRTPDATRSFVVEVDDLYLTPLGTQFSVRRNNESVDLAVFSGAVASVPTSGAGPSSVLHAGRQRRWWLDALHALEPDEPADGNRAAWTRGVLLADAMRLDVFVAALAPYWKGHLGCGDDVTSLLVTGAFPLWEPTRITTMLMAALPVRVSAPLPWWTTIEAR